MEFERTFDPTYAVWRKRISL